MTFFRRKTKDNDADSTALLVSGGGDSKGSYDKDRKDVPKSWARDMTEWVVVFFVCLCTFYFFTFNRKEREFHKQQVDAQLEVLAKQFEDQKNSLTAQLDGLYQQLFAAEKATQEAAAADDAVATTPVTLSAEEQRLQAEIDRKKAELEQKQKKLASFCSYCTFDHGGLRTTCGARSDFLQNTHGTPYDTSILAVMEWDPGCSITN